jgi:hypothetical protein
MKKFRRGETNKKRGGQIDCPKIGRKEGKNKLKMKTAAKNLKLFGVIWKNL